MFYVLDVQLYKLDTWGVTQWNQNYDDFYILVAPAPHQKKSKIISKLLQQIKDRLHQ